MSYRSFTDDQGTRWEVWDVVPQWAERRHGGERRQQNAENAMIDPPVIDERSGTDRRGTATERVPRVRMTGGFGRGWLAFESATERRRLAPIPAGWAGATDADLKTLCDKATFVPGRK